MSFPLFPALLNLLGDNIPILMAITILKAPLFLRGLCNLMLHRMIRFQRCIFFSRNAKLINI